MTPTTQAAGACPEGEMTIYRAAQMKVQIIDQLAGRESLEMDLSRITELDGAGLQLLMLAKREAAARGCALRFTAHSPAVLEVLDLANLAGAFGDPVVLVSGQ